ncbi:hypothetical protein EAY39_17610 [Vibrio anguillarum]|nr:hypothetical protein [Vibrio anguillarum]
MGSLDIFFGLFILVLCLWCGTGFYLASKYQNLLKQIRDFRETIKSHSLSHEINDNQLYSLVIEESRRLLPDDKAKKED